MLFDVPLLNVNKTFVSNLNGVPPRCSIKREYSPSFVLTIVPTKFADGVFDEIG